MSFESYCNPGMYIVFHNRTTIGIGEPNNANEWFERISPMPGAYLFKSHAFNDDICFLAFDGFGNAHNDYLCEFNGTSMDTLIMLIDSVEETACGLAQRRMKKEEL